MECSPQEWLVFSLPVVWLMGSYDREAVFTGFIQADSDARSLRSQISPLIPWAILLHPSYKIAFWPQLALVSVSVSMPLSPPFATKQEPRSGMTLSTTMHHRFLLLRCFHGRAFLPQAVSLCPYYHSRAASYFRYGSAWDLIVPASGSLSLPSTTACDSIYQTLWGED